MRRILFKLKRRLRALFSKAELEIILGQGLRLVLVGLGLGLIGAFALTRMIRSLMFGVTPSDPLTFIAVSSLLIVIAIAAGAFPAFRATKLDPLRALRE